MICLCPRLVWLVDTPTNAELLGLRLIRLLERSVVRLVVLGGLSVGPYLMWRKHCEVSICHGTTKVNVVEVWQCVIPHKNIL